MNPYIRSPHDTFEDVCIADYIYAIVFKPMFLRNYLLDTMDIRQSTKATNLQ
jgi:hypothetical protein